MPNKEHQTREPWSRIEKFHFAELISAARKEERERCLRVAKEHLERCLNKNHPEDCYCRWDKLEEAIKKLV